MVIVDECNFSNVCLLQLSSATSSGWTTFSEAVKAGAAVAAETTSQTMDDIANKMNEGSKTEVKDSPITTL